MLLTITIGSGIFKLHSATIERNGGDKMLNTDKVRGRMAERRITQQDVAAVLGLAPSMETPTSILTMSFSVMS